MEGKLADSEYFAATEKGSNDRYGSVGLGRIFELELFEIQNLNRQDVIQAKTSEHCNSLKTHQRSRTRITALKNLEGHVWEEPFLMKACRIQQMLNDRICTFSIAFLLLSANLFLFFNKKETHTKIIINLK